MLRQLAMRQSMQAAHIEKDKAFESTHATTFLYIYMLFYIQIGKLQEHKDKIKMLFLFYQSPNS